MKPDPLFEEQRDDSISERNQNAMTKQKRNELARKQWLRMMGVNNDSFAEEKNLLDYEQSISNTTYESLDKDD